MFYIELSKQNYLLQIGDLFNSFGAGLSLNTFQDRNIDYNNAPRGASFLYYLNDSIDFFTSYGKNTFKTRTSPSKVEPDLLIDNELLSSGFSYRHDYFDFHYLNLINKQKFNSSTILNMKSLDNKLGEYLSNRYEMIEPNDYSMKVLEHNFGTSMYLGELDLYFEKSWVYHNKMEDERVLGYKYYFSSYLTLSDYGILYEYKNYNTPYYYSVFSNPPIVFKESASTLISRNLHNVNFSNEVGHHILINKSYSDQFNVMISSAFAYQHQYNDLINEPGFGIVLNNMLKMNSLKEFEDLKPYRQIYCEFNGWSKNNNFYYKIGIDNYFEYTTLKTIKAKTMPSQFTYKLDKGNSIATYLEYQRLTKLSVSKDEYYDYMYLSPSYNHYGKWIVSMFYDYDKYEKEGFIGADVTYYLSSNNIISFFFGSQKGGLVCANGTCVVQPDFEDGFKITSRLIF